MNLHVHDIQKPLILRTMLMDFISDHLAQSKTWLLKNYIACRKHNIFAQKERILGDGGIFLYEHNREYV